MQVSAIGKENVVEILAEKLDMTKAKAKETLNVFLDLIKDEVRCHDSFDDTNIVPPEKILKLFSGTGR